MGNVPSIGRINNFITKDFFEKIENTKNHNKRNFMKNKNLKKLKI